MSNPTIRDPDGYAFLSFSDYLEKKEHLSKDWITVGRMDPTGVEDQRTIFSLLAEKKDFDNLIKTASWEIDNTEFSGEGHIGFGHPYFVNTRDGIALNIGNGYLKDMYFEPFVFYRTEVGHFKPHFEIIQNFILYHDLRQNNSGHYVDPNTENTVIRIVNPELVNVQAHYLKDYLSARNKILIRYIDYDRTYPKSIEKVISIRRYKIPIKGIDTIYDLLIDNSTKKDHSFSWLRGKEIIYPYTEPHHHGYTFLAGKDETIYEKFKVDIDNSGKPIMLECHPWKSPMKLCYFKKEVLNKYYSDTRNFTIESNSLIRKHNSWSITYGINEEGLVHVWLKDLGYLPQDEQLYWKSNNVLPSGGTNDVFIRRQLMGEFAESDDPVERLLSLYRKVNSKFEKKYGFKLFKDLSKEDKYLEKITHDLVIYEQNEFDQQVQYLSKIFVDSINKVELEKKTKWTPSQSNENASIYFLENFLKEQGENATQISEICKGLRILQSIRSSSIHIKSPEYAEKIKTKLNLPVFNIQDAWDTLIGNLIRTMKIFESTLS